MSLSASTIFLEAPLFSSGGFSANSVAVADVNGDGKPDLLVANFCTAAPCEGDGNVGVLLGNGDGTFQPVVIYGSGAQNAVGVPLINGGILDQWEAALNWHLNNNLRIQFVYLHADRFGFYGPPATTASGGWMNAFGIRTQLTF